MSTNQETLKIYITGTSKTNTTFLMNRFCYALTNHPAKKAAPLPETLPEQSRMFRYRNTEYEIAVTHAIDLAAFDFSKSPEGVFMILCVTADTIAEAQQWAQTNREALKQWRIIMVLTTDKPDGSNCQRVYGAAKALGAVAHGWCSLKAAKDEHIIWIFTLPLHICWVEDAKARGHLPSRFRPLVVNGSLLDNATEFPHDFNETFQDELDWERLRRQSAIITIKQQPSPAEKVLRKNLRKSARNLLQNNSSIRSGGPCDAFTTAPVITLKCCNSVSACFDFLSPQVPII